jgi:hypothetical protein
LRDGFVDFGSWEILSSCERARLVFDQLCHNTELVRDVHSRIIRVLGNFKVCQVGLVVVQV